MQHELRIAVHYPLERGAMLLRCDDDWDRDIEPSGDGTFVIKTDKPFVYFKPLIRDGDVVTWSKGDNYLALATTEGVKDVYPHFQSEPHCNACELRELISASCDGTHRFRIFHPPGYDENTLKRYPVLYMHDGQNLFFPEEAFGGNEWQVDETLTTLDAMNIIDKVLVVGIYSRDRMKEYTRDGYEAYGKFIVDELKPLVDANYRTLTDARNTAVMGSSLGGVVSFYLGWQYPDVFGNAGCMSSTFAYNDDLMERVAKEPKRNVRFYLDSGWPEDNYEVTRGMRDLMLRRGFTFGSDLLHFAFPNALHDEKHWAMRSHIPFQFFFGK